MGKTIMVVDTDVAYLKMIKTCFTVDGHKVITCDQAAGAFETFLETKPDAVVTGIVLEKEDAGFTLAYQIKKASPDTPVIMITDVIEKTGIEFEAVLEEEKSWIKADALVNKPVRMEQIELLIEQLTA